VTHDPQPSPATVGLAFEDVRYGRGLKAWYVPGSPGKPAIVVVHGSGGNRSGSLDESEGLHGRGYSLFLIQLGYAEGHRPYGGGQRETGEIRSAIAYAHQRTGAPVVLLGYSLGGFGVSAAAAKGVDAVAVISDSGFASFQSQSSSNGHLPRPIFSLMAPLFPLFSSGGHLVDVSHAARPAHRLPALVIQGTADTMTPVHEARDLARALHAQLWIVPGVGHTATYRAMPQVYLDRLGAFIDGALASRAASRS
jgi:pimeloyl-ACP methyl ester carboxylesterase